MRYTFDARQPRVTADVLGPGGASAVTLVYDTGASRTIINPRALQIIGYDPSQSVDSERITTASDNTLTVPLVRIDSLSALGIERQNFAVAAHSLPPNEGVDGLLGTDFMRDLVVGMNFAKGWIELKKV